MRGAWKHWFAGAACAAFGALVMTDSSHAGVGSAGGANPEGGEILTAALAITGQSADSLLVVDPVQYTIAVYDVDNTNKRMMLKMLRYYAWDLLLQSYPSQGYDPGRRIDPKYHEKPSAWRAAVAENSSYAIRNELRLFLQWMALKQGMDRDEADTPEDVLNEFLKGGQGKTALQVVATSSTPGGSTSDEFVLVDTSLKQICWYSVTSSAIQLLSARNYTYDMQLARVWTNMDPRAQQRFNPDKTDFSNTQNQFWPVGRVRYLVDNAGKEEEDTPVGPGGTPPPPQAPVPGGGGGGGGRD